MQKIKVFSPASVANVNCGFDILGFALDALGDELTVKKVTQPGIHIATIEGADLPTDPHKNIVGVAGMAMCDYLSLDYGFEVNIKKNIRLGSGVGSSAASATGIVYAINQFLDTPLSNIELTKLAMKGEALASGHEHADNVAPSLYGGFTMITSYHPLHIVQLPVLEELMVTVIHPHISIQTKEARAILPKKVSLANAIKQTGNMGGLITGLYTNDYKLVGKSVQDALIEPHRKTLIPYFDTIKKEALRAGGLAFGISGSGPSMFTFSKGEEAANKVEKTLKHFYNQKGLEVDCYTSTIAKQGNRILSTQ